MSAVAIATDDDDRRPEPVEIVLAMLEVSSERTRREIQRLLAAELQPPPTAAERRLAELSFLSSLLNSPVSDGSAFRQCERLEYDRLRPPEAPSSRHLVETYGSWLRACRAAYGLQADGTTTGPGRPWAATLPGERRARQYTRDEVIAAVQRCAQELGTAGITNTPTSWQYDEWVRRHKLAAERRSQTLRLPFAKSVYRLFPRRQAGRSRWKVVLRAAGLG
jgi:hypothetical protein